MGLWHWIAGDAAGSLSWTPEPGSEAVAWHATPRGRGGRVGLRLSVADEQAAVVLTDQTRTPEVCIPGTYTLDSANVGMLLRRAGSTSPPESVRLDVYFVSTRDWSGVRWVAPVVVRDPAFGNVRLRLTGVCGLQVSDPGRMVQTLRTDEQGFQQYAVGQLKNVVAARFAEAFRPPELPVRDLQANYKSLTREAVDKMAAGMARMGVTVTRFRVEEVAVPPEVARVIDRFAADAPPPPVRSSNGATPTAAVDDPLAATLPAVGPNSARLPLADPVPGSSVLSARIPAPPHSGRILLIDTDESPALGRYEIPEASRSGRVLIPDPRPLSAVTPPPLPPVPPGATAVDQYHVTIENAPAGPFELPGVVELIKSGRVVRGSLAWKIGMPKWVPVETLPDLASYFASDC